MQKTETERSNNDKPKSRISGFIKRRSRLVIQLVFIALSFATLVVLSYFFTRDMVNRTMLDRTNSIISAEQMRLEFAIAEARSVIGIFSETVHDMIQNGDSIERIKEFYILQTDFVRKQGEAGINDFDGFLGYFERIQGKEIEPVFITGFEWTPPEGFEPTDRPWFNYAIAANGDIAETSTFVDSVSGEAAFAYSRAIFDNEGNRLGVVGMYVLLNELERSVVETALAQGGYGMLLDKNLTVLAHPNEPFVGMRADNPALAISAFADDLFLGRDVYEYRVTAFDGSESLAFAKKLSNGWYLGFLAPQGPYYEDVTNMAYVLSAFGAAVALALMLIMIQIDSAREKADRENQKMIAAVKERDRLLNAMTEAAHKLLDTEVEDFEKNLHESMGLIGNSVEADRVYIWKNFTQDDGLHSSQIYEWLAEGAPPQGSDFIDGILYRTTMPDWEEILSKGECINSLSRDMMSITHTFLKATGVLSVFVAPIFIEEEFWGFAGFDDCSRERKFTENEASILQSACLLIGNAFLHNEMTRELREAINEAHASSRSKSEFLANMSHEIRTPMNSIIGFSELAIDDEIPKKTKDYLIKILNNSEWLLQIINDILDISKIESGNMEMESIPFDLHELFASCRTVIMPKVLEKGLLMHFYAEPSLGKRLYGDPTRLRQALINLLSNAVKFTNSGMIKMMADIKDTTDDSVTMGFVVKDSGIGLTQEQMDVIFKPFTQAESGTTRKYGGSGLGLSITKNLIEIMGGELVVESMVDVGTKFSFEIKFPAVSIDSDEAIETQIVFDDMIKPQFEGEILLCEDNSMNQQVISEHLSRVGLTTVIAENGKIGVDFVQERIDKGLKQFNLIFMDIHMPVMDGIEAAGQILKLNTGIPVVALTANIMTNDMEIYERSGMLDCLGKPFKSQELWRCLMKYFSPLSWKQEDAASHEQSENEFRQRIINDFVKNNKNKTEEIHDALEVGDIELAHRLAHTLKGNAGQLKKTLLGQAALKVENLLKDGDNLVAPHHLNVLDSELKTVLAELEPLVRYDDADDETGAPLGNGEALNLLEKVEPLLADSNPDSLSYVKELKAIKGSGTLVEHLEQLDFDLALESLSLLKDIIVNSGE